MDTSLKTHHSFESAIVHRPLLLYSLTKHVHAEILYSRGLTERDQEEEEENVRH